MGKLKSLAGDTVVYGVSTILGRMLNWLLMPFYIRTIDAADYGMVVNIYSIIAVLLVLVTLGFETGYFRFVSDENRSTLFDTLSSSVFIFGLFVIACFICFSDFFCSIFEIGNSLDILVLASVIVLIDAYNAIYFAQLRYSHRSVLYSVLRLIQVVITVVFTLFFLLFLRFRSLFGIDFSLVGSVKFILFANLLGSLSSTIYFLPKYIFNSHNFDLQLLKKVLIYSIPLVGMGFFGVANQNIEKILILKLDQSVDPYTQLAIYGANYKIGVLMAIFTQSFRLAFEPFFFKENKTSDNKSLYGDAMKYFVYFGLIIYAGVLLFMPVVNIFLTHSYYKGNIVIPFILIGQLFFGVYYSLSMWYKVIDKTYFGILMSFAGLTVNVICNFILIPRLGYLGAAISTLIGYFVMMFLSLFLGNIYYPIKYPLFKIFSVTCFAVILVQSVKFLEENYFSDFWFIFSVLAFILLAFVILKVENLSIRTILINVRNRSKNNK